MSAWRIMRHRGVRNKQHSVSIMLHYLKRILVSEVVHEHELVPDTWTTFSTLEGVDTQRLSKHRLPCRLRMAVLPRPVRDVILELAAEDLVHEADDASCALRKPQTATERLEQTKLRNEPSRKEAALAAKANACVCVGNGPDHHMARR